MSSRHPCRHSRRRPGVLLLLGLAGCTGWSTQPVAPRELLGRSQPNQARLVLHDGRHVLIRRPLVRSDSVVSGDPTDTVGLALTEVESIALRRFHTGKTIGLVAGLVAVPVILCAATCDFGINFSPGNQW